MVLKGLKILLDVYKRQHNENKSLITRESANIVESLSHTIYEKTSGVLDLKSSVMLLLCVYAVYDIKTRPGLRPAGLTCLWWLYSVSYTHLDVYKRQRLQDILLIQKEVFLRI